MSATEQLCDHIDLLRKQHRAEITPSFGQIDLLFELSDRVRAEEFVERHDPRRRCCVADCQTPEFNVVQFEGNGLHYCGLHASTLRANLASLDGLWPNGPTSGIRAPWPVRPDASVSSSRA